VLTDRKFGSNQLVVFPDAREIPPDLFQPIAREFNYSETTFVLPPENLAHDAKVLIFAPQRSADIWLRVIIKEAETSPGQSNKALKWDARVAWQSRLISTTEKSRLCRLGARRC